MQSLPKNWNLIEEWEQSYVFENSDGTFCVFIDFDAKLAKPYVIGYEQLEGDFEIIEIEDEAYTTTSTTKNDAWAKAILLMNFIDEQVNPVE